MASYDGGMTTLYTILILLLMGISAYLVLFVQSALWTIIGASGLLLATLLIQVVDGGSLKDIRLKRYEIVFFFLWCVSYSVINGILTDPSYVNPYFNLALFLYVAYLLHRFNKK